MNALKLLAPTIAVLFALQGVPVTAQPIGLIESGLQGAVHYEVGDFWNYEQVPTSARKPSTSSRFDIHVRELGAVTFNLSGEKVIRQAWRLEWFANSSTDVSAAGDVFGVSTLETRSHQQRWFLHAHDPGFPLGEATSETTTRSNYQGTLESRSHAEYRPPLLSYVFPFAEGDEWVTISKRMNTDYDDCPGTPPPCRSQTSIQYHYKVLRQESVRVDHAASKFNGKTYDAWVVKKTWLNAVSERFELLWYVPSFCNHVKRQEYQDQPNDNQGSLLSYTEWLLDGKCAATVPPFQPSYDTSDPNNFSSTRHHGGIQLPEVGGDDRPGGEKQSILEKAASPGAGLVVPVVVLAALALVARGRRAD